MVKQKHFRSKKNIPIHIIFLLLSIRLFFIFLKLEAENSQFWLIGTLNEIYREHVVFFFFSFKFIITSNIEKKLNVLKFFSFMTWAMFMSRFCFVSFIGVLIFEFWLRQQTETRWINGINRTATIKKHGKKAKIAGKFGSFLRFKNPLLPKEPIIYFFFQWSIISKLILLVLVLLRLLLLLLIHLHLRN